MSRIRRRAIAGIGAGEAFEITRTFTRADIDRFGELTRDYNPEHYTNQRGEVVLGAELTGQLPRGEASHVLRAMVDGGDPTNPLRDEDR